MALGTGPVPIGDGVRSSIGDRRRIVNRNPWSPLRGEVSVAESGRLAMVLTADTDLATSSRVARANGARRARRRAILIASIGCCAALFTACTSAPVAPGHSSTVVSSAVSAASAAASVTPSPTPARAASTDSPQVGPTRVIDKTITRTLTPPSRQTTVVGPPPSTLEPAETAQPCPYLSDSIVFYITGQHFGPTKIIATKPYPVCMFYRSDGGWLATVRIIKASTPAAAVAAVNQHVPIAGSGPADKPAGWIGGSLTKGQQVADASDSLSVYAVSKGNFAIVAQENESPSIKARSIAICALIGSKLDSETAPEFCSGQPQS